VKIGIDARFYGPHGTGLGRYIQKLIDSLAHIDQKNDYLIFLRKKSYESFTPINPHFRKILCDIPHYSLREQVQMPYLLQRENCDLFHFGHFNVPLMYRGPFVVTIHDMIKHDFSGLSATTRAPLVYALKHKGYLTVFSSGVKRARKILVPSLYVKTQLIKRFSLTEDLIVVTYEAGDPDSFSIPQDDKKENELLTWYDITPPFVISVGNMYPYKNLERLILAVKAVSKETKSKVQLALVGARDVFRDRLEQYAKEKDTSDLVRFCGFVPDSDLVHLFHRASCYVFPSLSEGFGIPAIEAMNAGLPVVSSNAAALPEVIGDAAVYFDPTCISDMSQAIKKVVFDTKEQERLKTLGKKKAATYSWEKMARETLNVYETSTRA